MHDPRARVSEVVLGPRLVLLLALLPLPFLEGGASLLELLQSLLPVGRERVEERVLLGPVEPVFLLVNPLGLSEEVVGYPTEVGLLLAGLPIALRRVLGGTRLDLHPIQSDSAELDESRLAAQLEDLIEEIAHEREDPSMEAGEGGSQMLVGGKPPSGHILADGLLDASGAGHSDVVGIEEDLELEAGKPWPRCGSRREGVGGRAARRRSER